MHFLDISIRTIIIFFVLLLFTRILGRKQMSNLTFFNYIAGITIGTISASISMDRSQNIWDAGTALIGWVILTLLVAYMDLKSPKMRVILDGQPVIVIKNGQIMDAALKRIRLDLEQLNMMLREKGVFSIKEVDYAIVETDGKLSLLKKEADQSPTKKDLNIPIPPTGHYPIPSELVVDGKLVKENLQKANINEQWLKEQLQSMGISSVEEAFYVQLQKDGTIYVDQKDHNPKTD